MSLLFLESPLIGLASLASVGASIYYDSHVLLAITITVFLFLLYFYRYSECKIEDTSDGLIYSPCEGTVINVTKRYGYYYVAIFLSGFNRHTQIYPTNGTVIKRQYDHTGEFEIVMHLEKSANNEKYMHYIELPNGAVIKLSQIAGILPRMITASESVPENVSAGQYLGMIKFGSRIDMLLPIKTPNGDHLNMDLMVGDEVHIGDLIGFYS
jgi:phosphatidylserine decarboxylase